jgi:hypothetical protein
VLRYAELAIAALVLARREMLQVLIDNSQERVTAPAPSTSAHGAAGARQQIR